MSTEQEPRPSAWDDDAILDRVRADTSLTTQERETTFRWAKDEDRATVFTAEAGFARRLLAHSLFDVHHVHLEHGGRADTPGEVDGKVYAVKGTIPVGALKVRLSARNETGHAEVVSGGVYDDGETGGDEE